MTKKDGVPLIILRIWNYHTMSQQNNGENVFSEEATTEQKWKNLEKILNDYQDKLSLNIKKNESAEILLNVDENVLKNMTAEECGIKAIVLLQFSTFIQKEINRHNAKNRWADSNLNFMVGKYGQSYGDKFTKFEERKAMMIADNSFAKALNDMIKLSSVICEDLSYISKKIENMSNLLAELQRTKRYIYEKR